MSIDLFRCKTCGQHCYPARLLCFRCGGAGFAAVPCDGGLVEECTSLPGRGAQGGALVLASIRSPAGPVVIAALPAPLPRGAAVLLRPGPGRAVLGDPA